jgi:hypothetical protein
MTIKKALSWVNQKWADFEAWVASHAPGWKTNTLALLGMIGDAAYSLQSFVTGLPAAAIMSAEAMLIFNVILYVLVFWLRGIGDRVEARQA